MEKNIEKQKISQEQPSSEEKQSLEHSEQSEDSVSQSDASQKSEVELLNEKTADLEKQILQLKDQLLRKAAEFENYKKRIENESLNMARFAHEAVLMQLLPILDDFARSLKSGKEKLDGDPFYKGVEMMYAKFMKMLEGQGVKAMETIGKEFNVDFHDALMQIPRDDVAPHTILEEVEKGYVLYDKVIRHAKVIVSTLPVEEEAKN